MGLFYVWIKSYRSGWMGLAKILPSLSIVRQLMSGGDSPYAECLARLSPQFYVVGNGSSISSDYHYNSHPPETRHIFQGMIFVPNNTTIPPTAVTDHVSGRWYFMRSNADSLSHWYLRTGGTCAVCGDTTCDAIHVSGEYRTQFCVRVRNNTEVPKDFVMLGSDEVSIAAPKGHILYIDNEGDLRAAKGYQGETDLLFSDLKDRFITRAERQVNGEVWEYVESVERGVGEPWELTK